MNNKRTKFFCFGSLTNPIAIGVIDTKNRFVFYSNKVSLENVNQINKDISEFLETKVDDDIKDNDLGTQNNAL